MAALLHRGPRHRAARISPALFSRSVSRTAAWSPVIIDTPAGPHVKPPRCVLPLTKRPALPDAGGCRRPPNHRAAAGPRRPLSAGGHSRPDACTRGLATLTPLVVLKPRRPRSTPRPAAGTSAPPVSASGWPQGRSSAGCWAHFGGAMLNRYDGSSGPAPASSPARAPAWSARLGSWSVAPMIPRLGPADPSARTGHRGHGRVAARQHQAYE